MENNTIDHRLWHRFDRVHDLAYRQARRGHGGRMRQGRDASRGQGRVLKALSLVPEMSQKDLQILLDMRQQSLAELLAKLEEKGSVARRPSEEDRRMQIVTLTEAGRAAAEEVAEPEPAESPFDCLSEEEKELLDGYLERIEAVLVEKREEDEDQPRGRRHGKGHGHGRGHGKGRRRGEGFDEQAPGEAQEMRRHGRGGKGHDRVHQRYLQTSPVFEEAPAEAPIDFVCDHNCRACPLRAQGACIKRR